MISKPQLAAVVLAAGKGTRMRSEWPKVVHELGGRPLIHYPLRVVDGLGASSTVVVVGYEADLVRSVCDGFAVTFAVQAEQRGTGHAVACALPSLRSFRGDVLLLYGDLPLLSAETLRGLVGAHRQRGAAVSLLTATLGSPHGYGRIVRERGRVVRIVEQRDATPEEDRIPEVNVGIYCVEAEFLRTALPLLRPTNAQGELYLTDIVALAVDSGRHVADAPTPTAEVAQVNTRAELAEMERVMRERSNRKWMDAGVTLEDPATVYIGPDVEIGRDTVIGPNVQLRGKTRIGKGCRFDGTALVADTVVGDGVHVKLGVVISEAELGPRCEVGPFAHLRSGTRLAEGVTIGNFVETKKAVVAAGSKARHLSYLGDVDVGRESNIGAGTITCNYDGFRKHRTVIGDRVMIGSDSQLIAPVSVADDAYVATGTTVRKDVPAGSLAFNAKPQLSREGWVAGFRTRGAAAAKAGRRAKPQARISSKPSAAKARKKSGGKPKASPRKASRARRS